tara:strand:+ start:2121 stop:2360 length:240 start_codon:yes stop_codon:yes gene_type:complete
MCERLSEDVENKVNDQYQDPSEAHEEIKNCQYYQWGSFTMEYLPPGYMLADGLTKNLPRQKFEAFVVLINLVDARGQVE